MNAIVNDYNQHGFVILKSFIPQDSITKIFTQLDVLLTEVLNQQHIDISQFNSVDQKYLYLKQHHPTLKAHAYDLMKLLDSVQATANLQPIIDAITSITQTPLFVDNVLIRPDDFSNDRLRHVHQEGLGQISESAVNLWAPLTDVNELKGSIKFIPGSHTQGYVKHQFYETESGRYHGVAEEFLDNTNETIACMEKGDVLLFHPCLFHASAPMLENLNMRWTLIARYSGFNNVPYIKDTNAPLRTEQTD